MGRERRTGVRQTEVGKNTKHTLGMDYQEMPQAFSKPINMTTHLSVLTTLVSFFSSLFLFSQIVSMLCVCLSVRARSDWQA